METFRTEHEPEAYVPPQVVDYGDLVELTAHDRHGHPLDLPHHPLHPSHPHPHFSS